MRKRTLLTIAMIGLTVIIALLLVIVLSLMRKGDGGDKGGVDLSKAKKEKKVVEDMYADQETQKTAVKAVLGHKIPDPQRVKELLELRKQVAELDKETEGEDGKKRKKKRKSREEREAEEALRARLAELEAQSIPKVTLGSQLDKNVLEERLQLSLLKRGDWRATHFDMDPTNETPDPFYEVQLEYVDGLVRVGPAWLVNVATGKVVPRNEMAYALGLGADEIKELEELLGRPEAVVGAITNHRFESGIELGGVLLLHFINAASEASAQARGESTEEGENRIVGWTVAHDFGPDYIAYFQWIEGGDRKVARWRFDWEEKELEPLGLLAIDITSEHTLYEDSLKDGKAPVSIWPSGYDREKADLPRHLRWVGRFEQICAMDEFKVRCNALARILEQENFINAVQWLIADEDEAIVASDFNPENDFKQCLAEHPVEGEGGKPKPADQLTERERESVIGSCLASRIAERFDRCKKPKTDGDGNVIGAPDCRWTFSPVKVNVNTADADQLKKVLGRSNRDLAKAIVEYREANGPFAELEGLLNVEGMNQSTFDRVNGLTVKEELTGKVVVEYVYIISGQKRGFRFAVDPEDDSITPLDTTTQRAYWSVRLRT